MVNRYHLFAEKNVRDISGYNEALEAEGVEEKTSTNSNYNR